jgi:hypothetical protein
MKRLTFNDTKGTVVWWSYSIRPEPVQDWQVSFSQLSCAGLLIHNDTLHNCTLKNGALHNSTLQNVTVKTVGRYETVQNHKIVTVVKRYRVIKLYMLQNGTLQNGTLQNGTQTLLYVT